MFHLFNSDLELFKSILEEKEKNYKLNLIKKKAAGEPVFLFILPSLIVHLCTCYFCYIQGLDLQAIGKEILSLKTMCKMKSGKSTGKMFLPILVFLVDFDFFADRVIFG